MSDVKLGEEYDFAGLGAPNELLCRDIAGKGKISKNRAIARARGHFQRKEGKLDVNLHGKLKFASLKARNAYFRRK